MRMAVGRSLSSLSTARAVAAVSCEVCVDGGREEAMFLCWLWAPAGVREELRE